MNRSVRTDPFDRQGPFSMPWRRRGHDFWLQGAQPETANGPHRIGQCRRCSRKSANAADGDLAAVGFRNSVRAEIHTDLQGDRVEVGFAAAATPAPAGDQKQVAVAIKRVREMILLPYVADGGSGRGSDRDR